MFGDNRNARDWAIEDMTTDGNRMIDRKYRIVRERVKMGEILPVWIDGKTNPTDVGTKAQANAPMTESMIGQLTGLQEIPIPEGTEVLFGPVSNPIRRGNKQAGTVKISRKQMSREQQHTVANKRCAVTHPCIRALQRDDVILRAAVDDITKHVATVDMCTQPYGTQHPVPKRGIAKGDQFYAIHDQAIVGWNNSTNPPVDRNGLPLVDITIAPSAITIKFL